ncbi:YgaC family protein [Yersinia ruckeri]|nr:YgaC family protein [Yersinia ruckeri]
MYLRPDEVAKVLENYGFERDYVVDQAYGYRKDVHYVYVNREARMGRTALVIHPELKDKSLLFATPTAVIRVSDKYLEFPLYLAGEVEGHYGICHGFSSRMLLQRYLHSIFK